MSLQIFAALSVLAAAVWLWRLSALGAALRHVAITVGVIAALVFLGVISVSYDPDRVWELLGLLRGVIV